MRPIEFRVWCSNGNEWEKDTVVLGEHGDLFDLHKRKTMNLETHIIEQFIGLLDKNGAKIYENDIIKAFGIIYKVEFNMGAFHFVNQKYNLDWRTIMNNERIYSFYNPMFFEKVGNIHQNKELIKESE